MNFERPLITNSEQTGSRIPKADQENIKEKRTNKGFELIKYNAFAYFGSI